MRIASQFSAWAVPFVLALGLWPLSTLAARPVVRAIEESELRKLVGENSEFSEFHAVVELLDQLKASGFGGEIVQISPDSSVPDMRGIYYVLRSASSNWSGYSGRWLGLDNLAVRQLMRRTLRTNAVVMVSLGAVRPYHSIYLQPSKNDFAKQVAQILSLDREPGLIVMLGRQFLYNAVDQRRPRQLSLDVMEILNWDLPTDGTLALIEAVARARNFTRPIWQSSLGVVELETELGTMRVLPIRRVDVKNLVRTLQPIRLIGSSRRELLALVKPYLHTQDFDELKKGLSRCSGFLQ